jgi:hypothetical protein
MAAVGAVRILLAVHERAPDAAGKIPAGRQSHEQRLGWAMVGFSGFPVISRVRGWRVFGGNFNRPTYVGGQTVKSWLVVLAWVGLAAAPARAQDAVQGKPPPPPSVAKLSAALRAEASTLTATSRSRLFADLGDMNIAKKLGSSAEQRNLAGRLGDLTRETIRGWLLRDLEALPPPPATILADRLSERGDRARARIVAHAESIALEGILEPGQARSWRKAAGRRAEPLLPPRMGLRMGTNGLTEE